MKRIVLSIPFFRHRVMERRVANLREELKLVDTVNRLVSCMLVKSTVSNYNEGKFKLEAIESPEFYKHYVKFMLGNKVNEIASRIRVERAIVKSEICKVVIIHLPSSNEIGQARMVGFVITDNEATCYSLEQSVNNLLMICRWEGDEHFNFGTATDKTDFVRKIIKLSKDGNIDENDKPCSQNQFDELDLKHRLAREIGVRFEMLDFYMNKFQNKVILEMQGIDTSGIDEDIEDNEEWLRYCQWEIEQAKKKNERYRAK